LASLQNLVPGGRIGFAAGIGNPTLLQEFRMKRSLLLSTALLLLSGAAFADDAKPLAGKTIGITTIRADNQADRLFYRSAVAEVEALGGTVIGLDAQSNDQTQIGHIQTLIAQKPDAVIEILGNLDVLEPWLAKIKEADIPLFTIDTTSKSATMWSRWTITAWAARWRCN
jgi:monosaccharide ABC transporter substrate-binding protein, CUT2 family (TC 3.A.1.2.-)